MSKYKVPYIYGFWDRIEKAVEESGMSKAEIARKMGCDRKIFYLGRRQQTMMSAGYIAKFCVATGVSADYILGLKSEGVSNARIH